MLTGDTFNFRHPAGNIKGKVGNRYQPQPITEKETETKSGFG
jgi:hypothetical protein